MLVFVEIDGIIFDVRPAIWEAYSRAVTQIGMARTDEATLWRLVRTGAGDEQLVSGARPAKLAAFRAAFDEAADLDDVVNKLVPHDDVRDALRVLRELGHHGAVTTGENVTARHRLLRENGMGDVFPRLVQLPRSTSAAAKLDELRGDERTVVVFAASVELCQAADKAGLTPIGITSGPCIAKRLAGAGARATYRDLPAFAEALKSGDEALRRAGLVF